MNDQSQAIEELLSLYRDFGTANYLGEKVTQLQHALQASEQAEREGYSTEVILGAFFHDIGHLLGEKRGLESMVTGGVVLGIHEHAERGQAYLESLGFQGVLPQLVGMHVQAKRYLVATIADYHDRLSEASKLTLVHQGGPMSVEEVKSFTQHPLKEVIIRMRQWDEQAKDPNNFATDEALKEGLGGISNLLYKHLETTV